MTKAEEALHSCKEITEQAIAKLAGSGANRTASIAIVAQDSGISYSTISQVLSGYLDNPGVKTLSAIELAARQKIAEGSD